MYPQWQSLVADFFSPAPRLNLSWWGQERAVCFTYKVPPPSQLACAQKFLDATGNTDRHGALQGTVTVDIGLHPCPRHVSLVEFLLIPRSLFEL